jgi:DNA-binding CsgD family transcriptional regulator
MRSEDFRKLVDGTSDPAFVVDKEGTVVAWNEPAQQFFGVTAEQAVGKSCISIIQGRDECGSVCSKHCIVQQAVGKHQPIKNFDLQVQTICGPQWCEVSVLIAEADASSDAHAIHIVRPADVRTRLEMVMRDFVVGKTGLPADQATAMIASRITADASDLSEREIEILRHLAQGGSTRSIAEEFHISSTTVNNHVQHILRKLDAHSRLEAIRRAEHARLI